MAVLTALHYLDAVCIHVFVKQKKVWGGHLDIATAVQISKLEKAISFTFVWRVSHQSTEKQFSLSALHKVNTQAAVITPHPPRPPLCVARVIKGMAAGERLLGTQVDGRNDPVCLIRGKRYVPADPSRAGSPWKPSSIVADCFRGVLFCLSLCICSSSGTLGSLIFYTTRLWLMHIIFFLHLEHKGVGTEWCTCIHTDKPDTHIDIHTCTCTASICKHAHKCCLCF